MPISKIISFGLLVLLVSSIGQRKVAAQQFYNPASQSGPSEGAGDKPLWLERNGKKVFLLGVNYPWYNGYRGIDIGRYKGTKTIRTLALVERRKDLDEPRQDMQPGKPVHPNTGGFDREGIKAQFEDMQKIGIHVVRWFWGNDGRAFFNLNEGGNCSIDEETLNNVDEILKLAKKSGVLIAPVLLDFRIISGDTHMLYEDGSEGAMHKEFITDPVKRKNLIDNGIVKLVKRVNTSADADAVLYWEIMNEASNVVSGQDPATGITYRSTAKGQVSPTEMRRFLKEAYEAIKRVDPKRPIMPSGLARANSLPLLVGQVPADLFGAHYNDADKDFGQVLTVSEIKKRILEPLGLTLDKPLVMTEGPSNAEHHLQYYIESAYYGGWAGYYPWSYYGVIGLNPLIRYDSASPSGNLTQKKWNLEIYRQFNRQHGKDVELGNH